MSLEIPLFDTVFLMHKTFNVFQTFCKIRKILIVERVENDHFFKSGNVPKKSVIFSQTGNACVSVFQKQYFNFFFFLWRSGKCFVSMSFIIAISFQFGSLCYQGLRQR